MSNILEEEHWPRKAISYNHQVLKYFPLDVHSHFLTLKRLYKPMKEKKKELAQRDNDVLPTYFKTKHQLLINWSNKPD